MAVTITNEMITAAQEAERQFGIPASVTLAQIKLESGGSHAGGLSGLAANYNNLFGQKASKDEAGVTLPTSEYVNGQTVRTSARFKTYDSVEEAILDHGKKWGIDRVGDHETVSDYVSGLVSKGYATDPSYKDKVLSIIKRDELSQYDVGGTYKEAIAEVREPSDDMGIIEETAKEVVSPVITFAFILAIAALGVVFMFKAFGMSNPVKTAVSKVKRKAAGGKKND